MSRKAGPSRRRFAIAALVSSAATLLLLIYFWMTAPPDPLYGNLRLSDHLKIYYGGLPATLAANPISPAEFDAFQAQWKASGTALEHLDLRSLPLLQAWLDQPISEWRVQLADWLKQLGISTHALTFDHQGAACGAIIDNPEICGSLLPLLQPLFASTNRIGPAALHAFDRILASAQAREILVHGTEYSPGKLVKQIGDGPLPQALYAAGLLWAGTEQGVITNTEALFPALARVVKQWEDEPIIIQSSDILITRIGTRHYFVKATPSASLGLTLKSYLNKIVHQWDPHWVNRHLSTLEMGPTPERVGAAWALGNARFKPSRAVPLLIENLSSTNRSVIRASATALGQYGAHAQTALPYLSNLLGNPNPIIQNAASNSISWIRMAMPP